MKLWPYTDETIRHMLDDVTTFIENSCPECFTPEEHKFIMNEALDFHEELVNELGRRNGVTILHPDGKITWC